ncbi:MAG: T9SS type A sorting domain-containing protein [Chloroherpetonaceae bacterium]|nr:T9SS type A sorting domain-containing protein [Chloroherpetonaceae bacterium]MDW8436812.1 choice-of-anchor I family protein [Chloroherpetonaceae bacterium]
MKLRNFFLCLVLLVSSSGLLAQLRLSPISTFRTGIYNAGGAEIAAHDPATQRLFFVEAQNGRLVVLDVSNPYNPVATSFSPIVLPGGFLPNSVDIRNGIVAVAAEAPVKTDSGRVFFYNANGQLQGFVTVGALPDMITFNNDGTKVLTANEGEPNNYLPNNIDPEGSVSIVTLNTSNLSNSQVQTVRFVDFNVGGPRHSELPANVRIFGPGASVAKDLEPEYISVLGDTAFVTCQENNALVLIRISTASVIAIRGLGFKDHNAPGNGLDASDQNNNIIDIRNWPVRGLYQPDAIAAFRVGNQKFLVTANEGDAREYDGFNEMIRVGNAAYVLDPVTFPNAATLKNNNNLGRLNVTTAIGDTTPSGARTAIYAIGARSFSIWTDNGTLVWDSGDQFEQITAQRHPQNFNASNSNNTLKNRSDDKGPEPEDVKVARIGDSLYAFIGLERIGGVMTYNITNPNAPYFVDYVNNRNFAVTPSAANVNLVGDLGPEGVLWIPASQSPTGKGMVVVTNEISGTVTFFEANGYAAVASLNMNANGSFAFPQTAITLVASGVTGTNPTTVIRYTDAPRNPTGIVGNVSQYRWFIRVQNPQLSQITLQINTSQIPVSGIVNPANVSIFARATLGSGAFTQRATTVSGNVLSATIPVPASIESDFTLEIALGSTIEALPVELTSFAATAKGNSVELAWKTASETNNDRFEIERSRDNVNFTKIGFVRGAGTSAEPRTYRFVDEGVSGRLYYRLKQVDFDGAFAHSPVVEVLVAPPATFALEQNYPNPFNPATTIRYQLPVASDVRLEVFDMLGKKVATLVSERKDAGFHEAVFNAQTLSSGIYFYRLQAGGFAQTKKMMLVK